MRLYIKITLLLLIVWPKGFFGQTYFNMLYAPESGTWGGGTRTIVVTDSSYVMNRWAVKNSTGKPWVGFTILGLGGDYLSLSDTIDKANNWITTPGLIASINNSFIDAYTQKNTNPINRQFGIIKYDSIGHIIFHNIDTTKYPYIYLR